MTEKLVEVTQALGHIYIRIHGFHSRVVIRPEVAKQLAYELNTRFAREARRNNYKVPPEPKGAA